MNKLIFGFLLMFFMGSFCFGESGDPNSINDPNLFLRADINNDAVVNIYDLGIFHECFLEEDPNLSYADIDKDSKINLNDFAVLSNEWMKESIDYQLVLNSPNEVSGNLDIYALGYEDYDELFLLVDGKIADSFNPWQEGVCFNLESYCFSNGNHELRIFKYDRFGRAWLSQPSEVNFNNKLSDLNADDFVRGVDYHLTANYSDPNGSRELNIKVVDLLDDSIVFNTNVDGNLDLIIPSNVFSHAYYNIIIEEIPSGITALGDDEFEKWEKTVSEKFDDQNYLASSPVEMVITIPNKTVAKARFSEIQKIISECNRKNIPYCILYAENCTWENFRWMMVIPQKVCYWVNIGHGNSEIAGVQRTNIKFYDCTVVSWKGSDYPNDPNANLGDVEDKVKSMTSLHLYDKGKLKFVLMDTCRSGVYLDFAWSCGMFSQSNKSRYDQTYLAWKDITYGGWVIPQYTNFLVDYWNSFGGGDSVYDSIQDAIIARPGGYIPGENIYWVGYAESTFLK